MNQNVLNTDLTGKVAVVTGAGGVLCSYFAKKLVEYSRKSTKNPPLNSGGFRILLLRSRVI